MTVEEAGGTTLLDNSMVLYGSGISDGDRHDHVNLPVIVLGKGGGTLRTGPAPEVPAGDADVQPAAGHAATGAASRSIASATAPRPLSGPVDSGRIDRRRHGRVDSQPESGTSGGRRLRTRWPHAATAQDGPRPIPPDPLIENLQAEERGSSPQRGDHDSACRTVDRAA